MIRRILITALTLVLLVAAAVGLSLVRPAERPAEATVTLPQTNRSTCVATGQAMVAADSDIRLTKVGEQEGEVAASPASVKVAGPTIVVTDGAAPAGVLTAGARRTWVRCEEPLSSGILMVADPSDSEILLTNSDTGPAVVDLTLLGPDGEVTAVGARGIAIAPGVTRRVALSVLAPEGPVGVAFTATPGRVTATVAAVADRPARTVTATRVATSQVIAGIGSDVTSPKLIVTNPGTDRVDVAVEALGESGTYVPVSAADLSVLAKSTVTVDLASDLGAEPAALRIRAASPVGAAVVIDNRRGAPATLTAETAGRVLAVNAPASSTLLLTNPGTETVTAEVEGLADPRVIVRAGMTVAVPLGSKSFLARVTADGDLVGAAVSAKGIVVAPLGPIGLTRQADVGSVYQPGLR